MIITISLTTVCCNDPGSQSTREMSRDLSDLVKNGDPRMYYHWNTQRAKLTRAEIKKAPSHQYFNRFFGYCYENLNAGNSEEVIDEIQNVLSQAQLSLDSYHAEHKPKFDLLALAYLRDGEQKNCIKHHTPYSCLLPLNEEGQYRNRSSSEQAIDILRFLYKNHPQDLQNRWLLNIAHMTLGTYPEVLDTSELINLPQGADFPRFREIAMSTGTAQNGLSGGVCIEDFNNDGYLDIFTTSYWMTDQAQYYENDQTGGFINKTAETGITGIVGGLNCLHADYDGDGNLDILILRGGWLGQAGKHPNSLLKGNGDGTFDDVTYASGLITKAPCKTAVFLDYDLDGDLDIFFGNEGKARDRNTSELYRNNGDATFTNVSKEAGLDFNAFVKGVTSGDYNNDGYPDLYVSVLGSANLLYKNLQDGTFQEVAKTVGVTEPKLSFPTWFFDVNNDGWEDLFVGSYDVRNQNTAAHDYAAELLGRPAREEQPRLYINQQDGTYKEASIPYGVRKSMYAMGSNYGDLDKDGYLDFYVGTGTPHLGSVVPNRMFRNVEGQRYEEVTYSGGFGHVQKGHGIAFADLNNDGDQEVYAVMGGAYEGDTFTNVLFDGDPNAHHWISIRLISKSKNRNAIGAKVIATTSERSIFQTVSTGASFGSNPLRLEIGLGKCDSIISLQVQWPDKDRTVTLVDSVTVNRHYTIDQTTGDIEEQGIKTIRLKSEGGHHRHH